MAISCISSCIVLDHGGFVLPSRATSKGKMPADKSRGVASGLSMSKIRIGIIVLFVFHHVVLFFFFFKKKCYKYYLLHYLRGFAG